MPALAVSEHEGVLVAPNRSVQACECNFIILYPHLALSTSCIHGSRMKSQFVLRLPHVAGLALDVRLPYANRWHCKAMNGAALGVALHHVSGAALH